MRVEGLSQATLNINRLPCAVGPGCANNLPHMLPEGARLGHRPRRIRSYVRRVAGSPNLPSLRPR
ncbi:DddA-like double-stranded DNA deaminase toxin [Sorangium sp. So ce131]|uniref:DddA-like double-stranded DNA deaminase toxin n=1 Tax=Sorangium sp. So ce131 TaxID=3133282 RepID=UPI003F5DFD0A